MKNPLLIVNAVLAVAVAALFYLHFSAAPAPAAVPAGKPGDLRVAYVKSDTLLKYYEYFKAEQAVFQAKEARLSKDIENREASLRKDLEAYQSAENNMTRSEIYNAQAQLTKRGENLELFKQSVSQSLLADQDKFNKDLYGKISGFLKTYAEQNGLQLVVQYTTASDVLYGAEPLDITKAVLDGLNEAYRQESGKLKTPAKEEKKK
ncbi:MAG: OmpH family outer membrane protein [Bacteroidota bacterium]